MRRMRAVVTGFLLLCAPGLSFAVELTTDTATATAGYYQLQWKNAADNSRFEIEEADNSAFHQSRQIYQGPDRARVITGQPDGTYYYRARIIAVNGSPGPWSKSVKVEVEHHPLSRALGFFSVGAVVFVAILLAILIGNRRYHIKESV